MAQVLTQPAAQVIDCGETLEIGRSVEDCLDWAENHQRVGGASRRTAAVLVGVAFTLTAATIAAMAFTGF